jgi:hypothetical protein
MIGLKFSEILVKVDERKSRRFSKISVRNYSDFTASNPRRPLLSLIILFNTVCLKHFCSRHGVLCREKSCHPAGETENARACQMRRMITANTIHTAYYTYCILYLLHTLPTAYYPCVSSIYFEQIPLTHFVLFSVITCKILRRARRKSRQNL